MFEFERIAKKAKKPDVTPLIDIIFQLILFFMLTTTFVRMEAIDVFVSEKGQEVPAPQVHAAVNAPLVISLKADDIFINNSKVSPDELPQIIGKEIGMQNNRQIKLLTTEGVSMQQLIDAVDIIRAGGAVNITIDKAGSGDEMVIENGERAPLQKVPLPELQSTRNLNEKINSGNFRFEGTTGWMPE